jgi:CDP-glucose 4,6-dehydratase
LVGAVSFWNDRRVFVTGNTGFKGAWLTHWLTLVGAKVFGYALSPPTSPSLFDLVGLAERIDHSCGDVRDLAALTSAIAAARPEIVIHMAGQSLVRLSYEQPAETYATNVMGTVNLLEAVRGMSGIRAVVCVTSDKCYENQEWDWGYRENEPLGGYDPYSSSKACAELVVSAYRRSYFPADRITRHGVALASVRAGNVIGGGDWAKDRIVPDIMHALMAGHRPLIRYPEATRPWQHVLEPLSGYLMLAERLWHHDAAFADAWNFGPHDDQVRSVAGIADRLCALWGDACHWDRASGEHVHEATYLKLDCSKARSRLKWQPQWNFEEALSAISAWYHAYSDGSDIRALMRKQIDEYAHRAGIPALMPAAASESCACHCVAPDF